MIELTKYNQPEIVWKKTSVNIGYEIYRAMSKKIKWQKIAVGEKNSSYRYTDKKAKIPTQCTIRRPTYIAVACDSGAKLTENP